MSHDQEVPGVHQPTDGGEENTSAQGDEQTDEETGDLWLQSQVVVHEDRKQETSGTETSGTA